jgi:hypothetical protein
MRGLAALARREIEEHRIALLAALVAGLLAAGAPLLSFHGGNPGEVREAAAVFVALALAAGLSISLGSSVLSREIANRRIGFFFARPISSAAIWGGKLAGSAAVAAGAAALVLLPSFLVNRARFSREIGSILLAGVTLAVAVLLPIAHALGIVFRSRLPRLGADLALFVLAAAAIALTSRWLMGETTVDAWRRAAIALVCLLLGAVVAAGFAAVARGRVDIQEAHRALSRLLWPVALGAAALFAAYAKWIVSVAPGDLAWIWVSPAPRGDWVTVSGRAPSRAGDNALFLLETSTGEFVKLKNGYARPVFSADGRAAVWLETSHSVSFLSLLSRPEWMGSSRPVRFHRFALGERSASPKPTDVLFSSPPRAWAISSDGKRLAAVNDQTGGASANFVSVYELSTARLLAAAAIPPQVGAHLLFLTPDHLRIYLEESLGRGAANDVARQLAIYEMDVIGKKLIETGRMGPFAGFLVLRTDAGASRAIVLDPRGRKMTLHDGRSGRQLAVLSSGERRSRNAAFLGDGRIVQVESSDTGTRVRIFSSDGEEQRMVPIRFGPGWRIGLGGEILPGVVAVAVRSEKAADWKDSECLLVDTRTGQTRTIGEHLFPAAAMAWWGRHDPSWYPAAGSEATRLFLDARGSLIHFDASTGKRRVILAGHPSP